MHGLLSSSKFNSGVSGWSGLHLILLSHCFLVLFLSPNAPQAQGASITFYGDATCSEGSRIRSFEDVDPLSCLDISGFDNFVGFTWPTDIGQLSFYNHFVNDQACPGDAAAKSPVASINVGWVSGCHVVDPNGNPVWFGRAKFEPMEDTAATVQYASTAAGGQDDAAPEEPEEDQDNVVTRTVSTTTFTTITPDDTPTPTSRSSSSSSSSRSRTSTSTSSSSSSSESSSPSPDPEENEEDSSDGPTPSETDDDEDEPTVSETDGMSQSDEENLLTEDDDLLSDGEEAEQKGRDDVPNEQGDGGVGTDTEDRDQEEQEEEKSSDEGSSSPSQTLIVAISTAAGGLLFVGLIVLVWYCKNRKKAPGPDGALTESVLSWHSHVPLYADHRSPPPAASLASSGGSRRRLPYVREDRSEWASNFQPPSPAGDTSYIGSHSARTPIETEFDVEDATTILPSSSVSQRGGIREVAGTTVVGSHMPWDPPVAPEPEDLEPPATTPASQTQEVVRSPSASRLSEVPRTVSRLDESTAGPGQSEMHQSLSASDLERDTMVTRQQTPYPRSSTHSTSMGNWI